MRSLEQDRIRCWVSPLVLVLAAATASGHSLVVARGTLTVASDRLRLTLAATGGEVLHGAVAERVPGEVVTADQWTACLDDFYENVRETLIIRDAHGRRIAPSGVGCSVELAEAGSYPRATLEAVRVACALEYPLAETPSLLVLQQHPRGRHGAHASQVVLAVAGADGTAGSTVRLTSGGNTQVVLVDWTEDADVTIRGPEEFAQVTAALDLEDGRPALQIRMPLALLATWVPVPTGPNGEVSIRDQAGAAAALRRLLRERITLRLDGVPHAPSGSAAWVQSMADSAGKVAPPDAVASVQSCSLWTTWIHARMSHAGGGPIEDVELEWGLFNGAVLSAEATVTDGASITTTQLTPYKPTLRWRPPAEPRPRSSRQASSSTGMQVDH